MSDPSEWSRRVYERHLDRLLAEELECRPSFAGWLLSRGVLHGDLSSKDAAMLDAGVSACADAATWARSVAAA